MVVNHLLPADIAWYAYYFWAYTMGIQSIAQMGILMGKVAHSLSDSPFLWCDDGAMLYFVGFYVLLLFDVVLNIQAENLMAITQSEQTMAAYLQNSFFSAGYLMAASIVAMKCLNLVPDLAAWMIPEGETAFSTRNFGEGVAQQAKMSAQGMMGRVL